MRIAFLAQPFDRVPGTGSVAIWIREVARQLEGRHEVTVYSRAWPGQPAEDGMGASRHVRVDPAQDERVERWVRAVGRRLGAEEDFFYRRYYFGERYARGFVRAASRAMAREGPDAIVLSNFAQFAPILRRHNPRARLVLMMHCDWLVELPERMALRRIAPVDAVCGCSGYVAGGVARRFPQWAGRCHAIHNGADPSDFGDGDEREGRAAALRRELGLEGRRVVLFVGRVCPEKGTHVLLEAMRSVVATAPDATLLVVGGISRQPPSPRWLWERDEAAGRFEAMKADYEARLRSLAAPLGERVRMLGRLPYEDLPAFYALADVFVHPAVWEEPFGLILTEAMAAGRAVVSTRTGGIPEVVAEGETGLLARPGDPGSLAEAILALLADPGRARAMGRLGRERLLQRFTWSHSAEKLESVLRAPAMPDPALSLGARAVVARREAR